MAITYQKNNVNENSLAKVEAVENTKDNVNLNNNYQEEISQAIAQEFKAWRQQLQDIIIHMRQAVDFDTVLQVTVEQVRGKLNCDRAFIYQFNSPDSGTVLAESRAFGWTPTLGENIPGIMFGLHNNHEYVEPIAIDDGNQIQLTAYQKQLLDKFQIQTSLSVPIIVEGKVWGILGINSCSDPRQWQEVEITLVFQVTTELTYRLQAFEVYRESQLQEQSKRSLSKIIDKILRISNIDKISQIATQEVRQLLKCDRVSLYKFHPDWSGEYIAESVGNNWVKLVGPGIKTIWEDTYLQETQGGRYRHNECSVIHDVYKSIHSPCHLDVIEQFEIKAYIIVPVFTGEKLWGLLAAYQNSGPRNWRDWEVNFLSQIGLQLGVSIAYAEYLEQVRMQSEQLVQIAEKEKAFTKIVNRIRQAQDVETIFKTTTQEVRQFLKCDRMGVYQLLPEVGGKFIAESVGQGWTPFIGTEISDTFLKDTEACDYFTGRNCVVNDIHKAGFNPCHLELLNSLQAQAYIIVPIIFKEELWGLLALYQNSGSREWQDWEINFLNQISSQLSIAKAQLDYIEEVRDKSEKLAQVAEKEKSFTKIVNRIRQAHDVDTIFRTTTQEIRLFLKCDRVAVFQFYPDWSGLFVAESVGQGWTPLVATKTTVTDSFLQDNQGGKYVRGEYSYINDIYAANLKSCHIELLETFQAKAYMIVPIFFSDKLWGLLAAYQNTGTREWQEWEANFLNQIASQFSIAKAQLDYIEEVRDKSEQLAQVAEKEKAFTKIVNRIRQAHDVDSIFRTTTQEMRQFLKCDRAAVYQFDGDCWGGRFVAESVGQGWTRLVTSEEKTVLNDTYLQDHQGGKFIRGEYSVINDIYQAGFQPCHIEILETFDAKAYIIVPIFFSERLWGLLAVYQNSGPREWQEWEAVFLNQIASQFSVAKSQLDYLEEVRLKTEKLTQIAEQEKTFTKIVNRIRQALELEEIFKVSTQDVRQFLKCDRVVIFRFNPDWSGLFVAESVGSNWVKLVGPDIKTVWEDTYLQETQGGRYVKGESFVVNDIYQTDHSPCHLEILEQFEARAYVIVPIFFGEKLWGLLAAYQNSGVRTWEESEVAFLARIGDQLGLALQQTEYLQKLQIQSAQLAEAAARDKAAKELLQQRSIQLLTAVRPALNGDLTVRAPITEDELGTIADAYNNTLQALRQIVLQVQTSSQKVAETSSTSNTSLAGLNNLAQQQSDEINMALSEIQQMLNATQAVVSSAELVQVAVKQANQTVEVGDAAMNQTVQAIQAIRETVAQTSKKIKRLGESSQKISKVVNLISNFATQTNVLALNAAIEATRAGEYGKGFAVVADEVRSLSRQSAAATIEIEKLVQEIQEETGEVAVAMETGIQQVVEGTNFVNETRQNLNAIVSATAEISQLIHQITDATQKQMGQSVSVTNSMKDVAEIANKTFGESQELAAVFQDLSNMAQNLLTTASKFKVS
ncbi:MAG: GAF domain-containing protein [Trichormus sp.]